MALISPQAHFPLACFFFQEKNIRMEVISPQNRVCFRVISFITVWLLWCFFLVAKGVCSTGALLRTTLAAIRSPSRAETGFAFARRGGGADFRDPEFGIRKGRILEMTEGEGEGRRGPCRRYFYPFLHSGDDGGGWLIESLYLILHPFRKRH